MARINFSHGDFGEHQAVIWRIRAASRVTGRCVASWPIFPA
ncbi:MAG: pyruvate kinase [Deltaproteobacteria bacterium]|nr:pyruvate kinase [Deltaproteobacteria bacterium]